MKVIVIGCTHAGTAAVTTMLNENEDIDVTIYERNDNVSFLSCGIALYVGGVVKDVDGLFYSSPDALAELGANVKMEHDVLELDQANKKVQVKDLKTGEVFEDSYDKLVLSSGSWPIIPPIDGLDLDNVLLCKNFNHAQEIIAKKNDKKRIAVVGGGYIGIELVEAFAETGKEVVLIDGMPHPLSKYLDSEMTDILEETIQEHGVEMHMSEFADGFVGDENGAVKAVRTNKGEYECDMAILCVGFKPNNELFGDLKTFDNGALIVDDFMHTSDPDIYACGDSCAVNYNPNDGHAYIPLATNAVRMGNLVGKNIKEDRVKYRGTQSTSGLKLFGWNIGSTGVNDGSAESFGLDTRSVYVKDFYRPEFMPTNEVVHMKLVYEVGTGRIVGGQLMSKYDITQSANTLSLAIQNHMTIEDLAYVDFLFQPHFDRPWHYLNILAQAALDQEAKLAE
ncbi:FAD-dependent oxidoreductase [Aerococcus sp. UMB10185]|uniref:FAD-dependent oxidoreductase n=1 Tax=unclassified Aerococcus TaxID=2618060 RepID=UPI0008A4999D|nr:MULTISPECIES: FAD-dependent oxidoreductase [unclassified Aerococcus]KAB0645550.1 SidA/IucD/PvdA family monooxygenase [Aerococcus sanguinicola]MDK6233659.1 FAD-dependent oxidoreductase [Aerococcus sp. UMB10185]MDK6805536.1 FAD-dependent oxidoreductase [Aerococcus sp. UMB7834]MDK8503173.1 FAD-dependent oxidoreductase [Aerococcus sp. UMB1112A]OFN03729.1 NADH oxidase [Aerococcus sp. HMSC062A02]